MQHGKRASIELFQISVQGRRLGWILLISCVVMLSGCGGAAQPASPNTAPTQESSNARSAVPAHVTAPLSLPAAPPQSSTHTTHTLTASPAPIATRETAPRVSTPPPSAQPAASAFAPVTTAPTPPASTPTALSLVLHGSGAAQTDLFTLQAGPVVFDVDHGEATHFTVFLLNEQDDHLSLLASANTPIRGRQFFNIRTTGTYKLHAIAQDSWKVTVTQPLPPSFRAAAATAERTFTGSGPAITAPVTLPTGSLAVAWQHDGVFPFVLTVWTVQGERIGQFTRPKGTSQGTTAFDLPRADTYVLNIQADGRWTLALEP